LFLANHSPPAPVESLSENAWADSCSKNRERLLSSLPGIPSRYQINYSTEAGMALKPIIKNSLLALAVAGLVACETVQTTQGGAVGVDRKQSMLISSQEMEAQSSKEYAQVLAEAKGKGLLNRNAAQTQRVKAIANRLIPQTGPTRSNGTGKSTCSPPTTPMPGACRAGRSRSIPG
jgi:hypothetical protein